jgi:hypothetical protein
MSDLNKVASWPTFEAFVADDSRRSDPVRVPLGTCLEAAGSGKGSEEWELLWLPGSLEVVQQRVAELRAVRLVARVRHRDYLEDVIEVLDERDENQTARNERLAARRGGSIFGVRNLRVNWRRYSGASALIDALEERGPVLGSVSPAAR